MSVFDRTGLAVSRRNFLIAASLTGAGLVIGLRPSPASAAAEPFAPDAFIRIPAEGKIVFVMASVEMGQGIYTAVAMMLAEELDVTMDQVILEHAPADPSLYANPLLGDQITGGSLAVRGVYEQMRKAGAAARIMLVNAAARGWGVAPGTCTAEAGHVLHGASGRSIAYGDLIEVAAAETVPQEVPLKPASSFKLIGQPARRLDSPEKVNGTAKYGIDARPEGVSYAAIAICPHFGGKLRSVDDGPAMAVKGVKQIVRIDEAVAVVADNTGAARKALAALAIDWDPGPHARLTTADLERRIEEAVGEGDALPHILEGDVAKVEAEHGPVHEFIYRQPILTHSAMEPMNCTVHVRGDGCEVWVGTQVMGRARQAVADVTGLPVEQVVVHNHMLGGGFGRRLDVDGVILAAKIARQVDGPVKVTWSREEDIRHDCYRYLNYSKVSATLGPDGMPVSWRHRVIGPSVMARWHPPFVREGIDLDIMAGAESPYAIPHRYTEFVRHEAPDGMLTGNWRGVGATRNTPPIEGSIDELAHIAGIDPLDYRRRLLQDKPRLLGVLDLAAEKVGWSAPLPAGKGRGIALAEDFGSFAAMIAEVSVADGNVRADRIVCAVDCGQVINPDTVEAQVQSGIVYGLSAALYGRITVENGAVVEGNFDDSPVLRINEMPAIEVYIVPSSEAPGGIGELGTPGVAPSLFNAIFVATGKRLRSLPIDQNDLRRV